MGVSIPEAKPLCSLGSVTKMHILGTGLTPALRGLSHFLQATLSLLKDSFSWFNGIAMHVAH